MSKAENLIGKRYGRLTVIEVAQSFITPKGKKQIAWKVRCDCGTEKIVRGCDLRNGRIISCGCYNREKDVGKKQCNNLTGRRFGRLIVESYAYTKGKRAYWNCTCDCGNNGVYAAQYLLNGDTKSCGCQKRDNAGLHNAIDLTGQRFSRLFVERLAQRTPRKWHCICDCGNSVDVLTTCLVGGHTQSCGCYQQERASESSFKDITGQRFGKLVAIKSLYNLDNSYFWLCKCDCGNDTIVKGHDLRTGNTKSCGCMQSGAEVEIANILSVNNVKFQRQKTFPMCKDVRLLKFDFYLPDYNIVIEYDGELHYMETSLGNDLEGQQRRDAIKTKYCEENDIVLLRIPYWDKDNIESILTDWLFLNDDEEANSPDASHP